MKNKNKLIIIATGVVIFMAIFIIGITYSWLSSSVTGNEAAKTVTVQTGTLSIKYTNGANIEGNNILPNWSGIKTFTVENTGTREAYYELDWGNITNEFTNKNDLVYTITGITNGTSLPGNVTEENLPSTGNNIKVFSNIEIEPNVTHSYTMKIVYKNIGNQNIDMGKSLKGKLEVKSSEKFKPTYLVDVVSVGQFVNYTPPVEKSSESKTCL